MSDCDHLTHPEHWLGDCGDTIASLDHMPRLDEDTTSYWLRTLGAIQ